MCRMMRLWRTGGFGASGALEACYGEAGPSGEPGSRFLLQAAAAVLVAAAACLLRRNMLLAALAATLRGSIL